MEPKSCWWEGAHSPGSSTPPLLGLPTIAIDIHWLFVEWVTLEVYVSTVSPRSNWNPLEDGEDSRRTRVLHLSGMASTGPCLMVLAWQDSFWRLRDLPNEGSSWHMGSSKGKPLKTSPMSSYGVALWLLVWRDVLLFHIATRTMERSQQLLMVMDYTHWNCEP